MGILVYRGTETRYVSKTSQAEAAARAEGAARGPRFSRKHAGEAAAHPGRVHQSAGAAETRRDWRHHRAVWFGAHSFAGRRPGAPGAPAEIEGGQDGQSPREPSRGAALGQKRPRNVALLRRGAGPF